MEKIFGDILKGILIMAVISAAILFVYQKSILKNPGIEITESIIKQDEIIDTSNWQTYRSDKFKLSFDYPSDWTIEETTNEWNQTFQDAIYINSPDYSANEVYNTTISGTQIVIDFTIKQVETLDERAGCNICEWTQQQSLIISGKEIRQALGIPYEGGSFYVSFFNHAGRSYRIRTGAYEYNDDIFGSIYDRILQSLLFN